ncbi:MAG: hypothetical protein PHU83_06565 [Eubacteriales bacterium]|nr:hypothetical protein [Eubacteriales bacterium]
MIEITDAEEIDLNSEIETKDQYEIQAEELDKLIGRVSNEDITDFLISEMLHDPKLKKNFLARFYSERISADNFISDFKSICRLYMGCERFIDYSRATRFFIELDRFLDRVEMLIDNDSLLQAAKVIAGITKGFDDLPLDDSGGGTTDFYMRIAELLKKILSRKDGETNAFVCDWVSKAIADKNNWCLSKLLQPVWDSQFNTPIQSIL